MVRPCTPSFSLYFVLLITPLAVSSRPNVLAKRGMPLVSGPVSVSAAPTATPSATPESELSAIQSSDMDRVKKARLEARAGTPITTFDDGAVLEVSSGVATNLPTPTSPATPATQNAPNPPPPTQAVPNPPDIQTTAAAQPGNANTNIIPTISPIGPSSTGSLAFLPAVGSTQVPTTLPSSLNMNGGTRSTTGGASSAVPHTTPLTLASVNATWVVQPFVSVFTTVDGNGNVYTTSAVFSSTSQLATKSAEQVDHNQSVAPGVPNESPSGDDNPPFLSQPSAAAGVIIAGVVASVALGGLFILVRRHRRQMQKQEGSQSVNSDDDYPQPAGDPFSASRRHSFQSDRSSTYEWHARARAELEAMEEVNRTAITYFAPPSTTNDGPFVGPTTYTVGKELTGLSAIREGAQMSPFADHATAGYAPAVPTPLIPLSRSVISVPSTYADVQRQQYAPITTGPSSLVPLTRVSPLRTRSRTTGTGSPTSPTASSPFSSSSSLLPPNARTSSASGGSRQPPPQQNDQLLLKRTPQPQAARNSTESTSGSSHPSTERRSRPSTTGEKPQERLSNPFEDADSINEEDLAIADAHASYFLPDYKLPELEFELGLGLGSSRASIEDVLGFNERLRMSIGRVDVRASIVTVTESEHKGSAGAEVVVPIVTVQAPSNEDGISLLSSEVDPREMMQSPDEENLFYMGGPRGFASLTAVGTGRR